MSDVKDRTKLKQKLAKKALEDALDAPIESDKWKNIYFNKLGNSFRGKVIWPSESSCRAFADENEAWLFNSDPGKRRYLETLDGSIYADEYSHTIQIPVKD